MKAHFVTSGVYGDYYFCPNCDDEMPVLPGQDQVTCEECGKHWAINYDYSFDEGVWRNCSTISEIPA